jgi:hypothetical protein
MMKKRIPKMALMTAKPPPTTVQLANLSARSLLRLVVRPSILTAELGSRDVGGGGRVFGTRSPSWILQIRRQ